MLIAGVFILQQPLSPAVITVDGSCSLANAIISSNTDTSTGGCTAGSGMDVIVLTGDVTLVEALPVVTQGMTLEGGDFTIGRHGTAPDFRILELQGDDTMTLKNVTITNGLSDFGGGIYHNADYLFLEDSLVVGNEATSRGGGIYGSWDTFGMRMTNSTVAYNEAGATGGGIHAPYYGLYVVDSTISGNVAASNGGGVHTQMYTSPTILNSTISGNVSGGQGGGIYNEFYAGTLTVTNSTIVGNSAAVSGGGIYNYPSFAASSVPQGHYNDLFLGNSIVAANVGGNCTSAFQTDEGGNFDDDGSCAGASPIAAGVDFDANLANNGGPTMTHALLPGSAAIDAGGACGLAADQRGFARDPLCDSGAVEFGAAPVGGSTEDVRLIRVTCRNDTTPGSVTFSPGAGVNAWDCEAQGLAVSPGDVVSQVVLGGATDDGSAAGALIGLAAERASCRNATTGQTVNLLLTGGPSFDCVAAGLVVNEGDRLRLLTRGQVP